MSNPYNGSGGADTTNLGWNSLVSQGSNVVAPGQMVWDPQWQNYRPPPQPGGNGGLNLSTPQQSSQDRYNQAVGQGAPGSTPGMGNGISGIISQQTADWDKANAANQKNWDEASGYLKGLPAQFASDPMNQGANRVTGNIMANPDVLSAAVQQQIMNKAQGQIGAAAQAGLNTQYGMMQGDGQGDASSMAAAKAASDRNQFAAIGNTAADLSSKAALANRQSELEAANAGTARGNANFAPGYNVGNSIISHLPQIKANDYTGLAMLANQMQNQQTQNEILKQNGLNAQATQNAALTRPQNPSANRLLGPTDNNQSQDNSSSAGFNFGSPSGGSGIGGTGSATNSRGLFMI